MASIVVSSAARGDLQSIRAYIAGELASPDAARRIIRAMRRAIEGLSRFPEAGKPLDSLIPVHTDYRYLVCEGYCIFYLYDSGARTVMVVRILHQRQDCTRALFAPPGR